MKAQARLLLAMFSGLLSVGCWPFSPSSPDELLTGDWYARGIGHSSGFVMSLQQTGNTITGRACANDSGVWLYRGAPVRGEYPHVRFVVTLESVSACCAHLVGTTFVGKIDRTRDIVGAYAGGYYDLRFTRTDRFPPCGSQ